MSNKIQVDDYNPTYPPQPPYRTDCGVNSRYKTIVPGTMWEEVGAGPATIKHLYSGIPNYYPIRTMTKPVGTMYQIDNSQFGLMGTGTDRRLSYQYKLYPLTHRYVREISHYADNSEMLPYMDMAQWTKYPVIRDASLNSSLQEHPQAYYPEVHRCTGST